MDSQSKRRLGEHSRRSGKIVRRCIAGTRRPCPIRQFQLNIVFQYVADESERGCIDPNR